MEEEATTWTTMTQNRRERSKVKMREKPKKGGRK